VVVSFALVLEGPDLLLLGVLDARLWLPVGLATGLVTSPVLWLCGVGFAPPWTLPVYRDGERRLRAVGYHLTCCVVGAWLWTDPTRRAVAWVRDQRGLAAAGAPPDVGSVAAGLVLAELCFLVPAVVLFVRLSDFRTGVDFDDARTSELLRTALLGVGGALVAGFVVTLAGVVVTTNW
jgi:hypothetical protein